MKVNFKALIPHGVALLVFILFASMYFMPLFQGYSLKQGDVVKFKGMSKEIVDYRVDQDEDPLWTNSMFGGMPAYQISVLHDTNFVNTLDTILKLGLPRPAGILFMSMLGFYILLMCLRVNPWLAIVGSVAYGFSTINILYIGAGHMTKVNAISYMAPALGGMILALRGRILLGCAIFALFLGLNVSANHLQMTYYLAFILTFVGVGEIIRIARAKESKSLLYSCGALAVAGIVAILPSTSNLMTTLEYSKHSTRGNTELTIEPEGKKMEASKKSGLKTDYILEYNYGEGELLSTIIPNARGESGNSLGDDEEIIDNASDDFSSDPYFMNMSRYWGGQNFSGGAFYFGVVVFVLFVLAMVFVKDTIKWPVVLLVILAMCLASKDSGGLNDFFIHKFPMYNKFRDSKMILVILQVLIPMMAFLFVDRLFKKEVSIQELPDRKKFYIAGGSLLVFFGFLYLSPGLSGDFSNAKSDKERYELLNQRSQGEFERSYMKDPEKFRAFKSEVINARKFIFRKDVGRAFIFTLFTLAFLYFITRKKQSVYLFSGVLLVLVSVDTIGVSLRYLNSEEKEVDEQTDDLEMYREQGYIDEEEELESLKHYEHGLLSQLPPQLPSNADVSIVNKEKELIADFNKKVKAFKSKMSDYYLYEKIENDRMKQTLAEFAVMNLNSDFRVLTLGNVWAETQTSYFHKSIGGYHGAKLKRYQELIDFYLQKEHDLIMYEYGKYGPTVFRYTPILNMLNTKYVILNPNAGAVENPFVQQGMGNAWFVSSVRTVKSADEEMLALGDSTINLMNTAVVHKDFNKVKSPANFDSEASITLAKYGINELEYRTDSDYDCPAVFSEIYYPDGWNCYVDGKKVETFRANYVLRGALIPKGKHKVVWKFEPSSMSTGSIWSGIGSSLLLLSCLVIFFLELKGGLQREAE